MYIIHHIQLQNLPLPPPPHVSFPDPNPSGYARGGHTSGGILPALPNGYTRSTRVAAYRHIATQK